MQKSVHGKRAKIFTDHLRALRERADMTQRDVAKALGREHGMIARIELGERRVDIVEVFDVFEALGADPAKETLELMTKFKSVK